MRWSPFDVEVGTTLGGIQEPGVFGKLISRREPIDGPGLSARPTRIVAPSLVGCLLQKLAGFDIKEAFVLSASIASHQKTAGGEAMVDGNLEEGCVFGLLSRVKDNPDVHHDVDEDTVLGYE